MNEHDREIMAQAARIRAAMREQVEHVCENCGKSFTGLKTAKFCSDMCKDRKRRGYIPTVVVCAYCGNEATDLRKGALFCSKACKDAERSARLVSRRAARPTRRVIIGELSLEDLQSDELEKLRAQIRAEIEAEKEAVELV